MRIIHNRHFRPYLMRYSRFCSVCEECVKVFRNVRTERERCACERENELGNASPSMPEWREDRTQPELVDTKALQRNYAKYAQTGQRECLTGMRPKQNQDITAGRRRAHSRRIPLLLYFIAQLQKIYFTTHQLWIPVVRSIPFHGRFYESNIYNIFKIFKKNLWSCE